MQANKDINDEEIFKNLLFNKAMTLLNKKRKSSKELIDFKGLDVDELLEEGFNNFFTNTKSFNNLNSSKAEQLSIISSNQTNKIKKVEEKTSISYNDSQKELDLDNVSKNKEDYKSKLDIILNNNYILQTENNLKLTKDSDSEEKEIISPPITEEKTKNNNDSKETEKILAKSKYFESKKGLCCQALDLLEANGEFQIKFSKTKDSSYILKIKIEDIKDNYFEQAEYAKNHWKKSHLYKTAPNDKFWLQRYYYFSKFDKGIKMDYESWYSVTPEEIAKYTAKLIKGKTIIDGFCGCGGNVIQFSKYCSKVYAVEISKSKLDMCKNNCKVYKCNNNIDFIHSDFLKMKNKIKADYIFLSPPWGGTEYKNDEIYSIKKYMYPDITEIVRVSLNVADNILFFLPRNLDLDELFDICSTVKNEIEEGSGKNIFFDIKIIKSNGRIKSLLIILGHHIKDYFYKHKLETFIERYYGNINEKNINDLYSAIKTIGCYRFFKEEYFYRTTKSKEENRMNLSSLNEYIINLSNKNEINNK